MVECASLDALIDIEARQDELLKKLDDLNREIERALISHGAQPVGSPPNLPAAVPLSAAATLNPPAAACEVATGIDVGPVDLSIGNPHPIIAVGQGGPTC